MTDKPYRRQAMMDIRARIHVDLREGCGIVLRGIASGLPFDTPARYYGAPLVRELEMVGLVSRLTPRHKLPGPFELTSLGRDMLEEGLLDD